jgi:RNA polymerase sigma-54 factor
MKQSLDLRLGQHLTITPQLQQAIRLLQLSSVELQQEIQEMLESNPLLEEREAEPAEGQPEGEGGDETDEGALATASQRDDLKATDIEMADPSLSEDRLEADYTEYFDFPKTASTRNGADDELPDLEARNSPPQTLRDHLLWQMHATPFTATDQRIAEALIDAIDEDGYLACSLDEIRQALAGELEVDNEEIEAVLHQIQNFDPPGVGARDLAECLRLQLRALPSETPYLEAARALATSEHLKLLAQRDYTRLKRALRLPVEVLQGAIRLIQGLNPRPGSAVAPVQASYIVPDIIVKKIKGVWRAELNPEVAPRLGINRTYERLIQRGEAGGAKRYLQEQLQQARWFIKSLKSRNETLLKVARTIVDHQRAFFDHGPEAMKPLVLHDVAEAVGMHESTISRVTTNKYMLTPRGVFELKYFFSSHVATADGGSCSATAIRSLIKKLVENEPPDRPISDSQIAQILAQQGIHVARRTVAKYRESMNIPPANQRKSLV